jgi:hypothetical protein
MLPTLRHITRRAPIMAKYVIVFIVGLFIALGSTYAMAQDTKSTHEAELKSQVPALKNFHTQIYQLWHNAWPKKDTTMMVSLWPDIEKGVAEVAAAELPGILREKKTAWKEGVTELQTVATQYKNAMAGAELQPKLDVAEKLHSQYEKLVRIIRPAMKEVDAFHQVLYMIYHYYLPEHQTEKLAAAVTELSAKMDTLDRATLPERLQGKEASFKAARTKLSASVAYLKGVITSKDEKKIQDAVRRMHSDYEALDRVFE